ncbi:hypothetical protein JIX56_28065 [Streptomyces sp. CA-210063]|uniref:hypothetical protein n=1 Tax=Streptomyces sp. CA-210063 TaxID=2801029 RepID=UPI00214ADD8F|nr:hypothetical protein [Streptomyces sp. CA-210063]UUU33398.1 hypothetical protein JIX56_28065 [Streptomyces sp. CA-210063]
MSVITTPAPRLPVRDEHTPHAVSPMLSRLAAERATGVLLRESGSLYLSEGEVVHAESPRSPGLDVLLTTGGILDGDGWREAVDTAGAGLRVGRFLVDSGRVARGALELCHAGALFDAAYFVLGPSGAPARFRYGAAHWLGPIRPVPVATVEREARRRRDLLHRIWPDPATDDAPLIRAASLDVPPVPARQGAVLGQVNGFRTAAEISLTLGRPAFHTLVDVRRLAAAGLISPTRHSPAGTPPMPAGPGHALPTEPGRDPSAELAVGDGKSHPTPPWPLTTTDPDVALLQRLRDALEAL